MLCSRNFDKLRAQMYPVVLSVSKKYALDMDWMQEADIALFELTQKGPVSEQAYYYTLWKRLDKYKRKLKALPDPADNPVNDCFSSGDTLDTLLDSKWLTSRCTELLESLLTIKERQLIKLYFYKEWTQQRIADKYGTTQQSINKQIQSALKKLRLSAQMKSVYQNSRGLF